MKAGSGGHIEQAYNAQAVIDTDLGFDQFLMCGLEKMSIEWDLGDAGVYREAILSHDWREIDAATGEGMMACDE